MSEANFPENSQAPHESPSAWYDGWGDFSAEPHHDTSLANETNPVEPGSESNPTDTVQDDHWDDWQSVNFPNSMSVDAIAQQPSHSESTSTDYWAAQAAPTPLIDLPTWAQNDVEPSRSGEQPPIADLISLIQELNQCNSALIDRVSQLEDALERSEQALQAELGRSHDQSTAESHELVTIHEQIDQLVSQLEIAHQTNQQQQDLLETLSLQFDSSQERVAQLERECVQLQLRYNEQAQTLAQRDDECRDLHIRLQRQQRYTLQFKVALERCLEVAPSPYESGAELPPSIVRPLQPLYESRSSLNPQPFLPKVPRIQPWSAAQAQPANTLKLESLANHKIEAGAAIEPGDQAQEIAFAEQEAIASATPTSPAPVASTPTVIQLPNVLATPDDSPSTPSEPATTTAPTVQALELGLTILKQPNLSSEAIQAGLAELQSSLGDWDNLSTSDEPTIEGINEIDGDVDSNAEGKADSDAEAMLWQDLARLIDISTDDVIKAVQAHDFASFEPRSDESTGNVTGEALDQLDTDLAKESLASTPQASPLVNAPAKPIEEPRLPLASVPQKMAAFSKEVIENLPASLLNGSSPSPIVYPLRRPTKKLESLAAVDLPTFPR
jgi:hypothetical protein